MTKNLSRKKIISSSQFLLAALAILALALPISTSAQTLNPPSDAAPIIRPALHTVFIVGDSTAAYHTDETNEGMSGVQGWGVFFSAFIDTSKIDVVNVARGGRSSRTYQTEGFWAEVKKQIRPGDIVLIQLGHNDVFPINDDSRARGTLPGIGSETQEIDNLVTHKHETVHTYGWYLRKYVTDARALGATPIVLSLTTRNVWINGKIEIGVSEYRKWARQISTEEKIPFVDVTAIMAAELTRFGQQKTLGLFHGTEQVHTTVPGGYFSAESVVAGLKALPSNPLESVLSTLGSLVAPATQTAP